ncbi:hypothetical protein SODALDRAFT_329335 [Sodiomyces alkalinus F11]|uniref:Septation initiation network scaffold protein cdc11 n=1 Tax=Sodiomyces alkalinus (strain CBS 110278 / VKM F-3762 / F11) TaxID=1314773 RepID=A0A3N2PKW4_SODAK|nr:hypothetical protein SODALDRAFT_329335 [Sodiomyces alkalinus F11]ROT35162.1 hypothetical protein SODALDRAFT_329335 [Sodiomyces alkalinus F11]
MSHAWLDSLSEDWPSQAGSDPSPPNQLPTLNVDENTRPCSARGAGSKIPLPIGKLKYELHTDTLDNNNTSVHTHALGLSERNIPLSARKASKLSHSVRFTGDGHNFSRRYSTSTAGSVVHNTVQHKSPGLSASKGHGHTPEWKRRLVYGEVQYGEQRDLFSSAAAGLEDIFKPPPPPLPRDEFSDSSLLPPRDTTMPSSPPIIHHHHPHHQEFGTPEWEDDGYGDDDGDDGDDGALAQAREGSPSPSPRKLRGLSYRRTDESFDQSKLSGATDTAHRDSQGQEPTARESVPTAATSLIGLAPPDDHSRKTSGQSYIRNEDFSPIILTCRQGGDGQVGFTPVSADQLKERLEKLRNDQMLLPAYVDRDLDNVHVHPDDGHDDLSGHESSTAHLAPLGDFVNVRRGGLSAEGSFRHRMLSPVGDTSEMLPEESLQASTPKQFPTIRSYDLGQGSYRFTTASPPEPRAPFPSPEKQQPVHAGSSPLKLFGPYDTFTNQTLLRRISQFEERSSDASASQLSAGRDPVKESRPNRDGHRVVSSTGSVSQFGKGDLEGYQFSEEASLPRLVEESRAEFGSYEENVEVDESPASGPGVGHRLRGVSHQEERVLMQKKRQYVDAVAASRYNAAVSKVSAKSGAFPHLEPARSGPTAAGTPKRDNSSDPKRPRTSPSKDPTPKRRRTLHRSDVAFVHDQQRPTVQSVQNTHRHMQSIMGKGRKDPRPAGVRHLAPASHPLSSHNAPRPRTPTPSQRSSLQRDRHPSFETTAGEDSARRSPNRASPPGVRVNDRSPLTETDRKPSIKTQDFVDQAGAIMAMIRNGAKPPSALASVEESDGENGGGGPSPGFQDDSYESTNEPFSRPPSREGKPAVTRLPARQEDPEILKHLQKYQEESDMGDVIASSLRSVKEAQEAIRAAKEVERMLGESPYGSAYPEHIDDLDDVSDPPNIRISLGPAAERFAGMQQHENENPTYSTGSTYGTIPTGSSRGSDSRRTIAPQSVSHLIPDQVGSMYLDRQNNIWIKRKGSGGGVGPRHVPPSSDTEDDPFASIPDLSVDLTKEMKNLRLTSGQREQEEEALNNGAEEGEDRPGRQCQTPQSQKSKGYVTLSPNEALSEGIHSQAREELSKLESKANSPAGDHDDVEQEIRLEDRITPSRRRITISFSSPIASIIRDMSGDDIDSLEDDEGSFLALPRESGSESRAKNVKYEYASLSKLSSRKKLSQSHPAKRTASRRVSVHGQAFFPRPVSRIEERDEDYPDPQKEEADAENKQVSIVGDTSVVSHAPEKRHGSLGVIMSTPGMGPEASTIIGHNVGNLSLSPLSEFTMNNNQDQSFGLEVSYIVKDRHLVTGDGSKRVMSMAVRELVDKLTEAEPVEPNWEDVMELDVSDKRLSSLHMLDEFCKRLVTLDASHNGLAHLDGVPSSVRQLKVTHNMLSELTSWDHLSNLQYIDVSNNELHSLAALNNLVHLRSVRADKNRLTSLDGLNFHDGLLTLRARDNLIEEVDLEGTNLCRLVELDLCGNKIRDVRNVDQLGSLQTLKLRRNRLTSFDAAGVLPSLRYLDISDNEVSGLDLAHLPSLRLLHADRNRISKVTGFARAKRLDSVSLREQGGGDAEHRLDLSSFLSAAYEVRKLFLSGNYLGDSFAPRVDFLNLQLLELANCGLRTLPADMGQLMPNLRSLNLNFNAIADAAPLRFIPRLKKLLLAGNRLADSTGVAGVVTEFPHLARLDLRGNPVTLGFYPPPSQQQAVVRVDPADAHADPFTLPEADGERDALFAGRLDEATRLRRRLYHVVFAGSCLRLRVLDGLAVDRRAVMAKDGTMEALVGEGLLPGGVAASDGDVVGIEAPETTGGVVDAPVKEGEDSRWGAEDSFA